jgi:hypothetical protein
MPKKVRVRKQAVSRLLILGVLFSIPLIGQAARPQARPSTKFEISFSASVQSASLTGRVILLISTTNKVEPRLQAGDWDNVLLPIFGLDADSLNPGVPMIMDERTRGFPVHSIRELPNGEYYVQAVLNVYTQCHRSDGHDVWVHLDHGEGQQFNTSPGNLITAVQRVHLDASSGYDIRLVLDRVIPPLQAPADTEWVKHIKFESKLLSAFWGCPIYLGATVLLPKGYQSHPNVHYPVVYLQGHFSLEAPFGFDPNAKESAASVVGNTNLHLNLLEPRRPLNLVNQALVMNETPYEFYKAWTSDRFPRVIAVTFQHPTPYYDDSYAVNSANNGPYGDAIMGELIPAVETQFRIIRKAYARVLTGGSTGGWESLALQTYHPDFFGGTWTFYPDPVDFRRWGLVNIYTDKNFFEAPGPWLHPPRYTFRIADGQPIATNRDFTDLESVLGDRLRSGEQFAAWNAVYGPVDEDGYPEPLYDPATGRMNDSVVAYMREHGYDLRDYLQTNWSRIGPDLVGKIHIACGDMDNFYLNLAVYLLEDSLTNMKNPQYGGSFQYGRPMKGHGWQPTSNVELVETMALQIAKSAPASDNPSLWHYGDH